MSSLGFNVSLASSSNSSSSSGIDVTAVVDQILEAERGPEKLWQQQQTDLSNQTSVLTSINASLNALADSVNGLKDVLGVVNSKSATSSQPGILTASAMTTAVSGTHILTVINLASTASYYSDGMASGTTLTDGQLAFTAGDKSASIVIDAAHGTNTLSGLADYINKNDFGVTASVIHDATGDMLAIVSKTTGDPGKIAITTNTSGLNFHQSSQGKNASFSVDGVPLSSATNSVTTAIPGVTLNLLSSAPGTQFVVTVGSDTSGIKRAVSSFVTSYNAVIKAINGQFAVDQTAGTVGVLAGNSSLRTLQSNLLSDITYSVDNGNGPVGLASMGIDMEDDGTLTVDDAKLSDILGNHFSDFQSFLQSTGPKGFAVNFGADLTNLTDPTDGLLNQSLVENSNQQKTLSQQIRDLEDRLSTQRQLLLNEYSRIDAMLRSYPTTMAQINAMLGALPQAK